MYNLRNILSSSLLGVIIGLFPLAMEGQTTPAVYKKEIIPVFPVPEELKAETPTPSLPIQDKEVLNEKPMNQANGEKVVEQPKEEPAVNTIPEQEKKVPISSQGPVENKKQPVTPPPKPPEKPIEKVPVKAPIPVVPEAEKKETIPVPSPAPEPAQGETTESVPPSLEKDTPPVEQEEPSTDAREEMVNPQDEEPVEEPIKEPENAGTELFLPEEDIQSHDQKHGDGEDSEDMMDQ